MALVDEIYEADHVRMVACLVWVQLKKIILEEWYSGVYRGKFFTCVTKTFVNLTTYRKPENYNGTNIFEIDIVKKSSPISLNVCQPWLFHNFFGNVLFLFTLKLSWECCESSRKEVYFLFWQWQKMWTLNWMGISFSWCQSQK